MILYKPDFIHSVFVNLKYDPTNPTHHELYYCRYIEMLGLNHIQNNDIFKNYLFYCIIQKIHQIHKPFKYYNGPHFV